MTWSHGARGSWLEYGAAFWALIFAGLHAVWAMGWYVGLDAEMARKAFQKTWMWMYDIVIALMCVLGMFLALAFVQPWGRRLPRRLVHAVGWCATGLLLLRSGGSVVQTIYFIAKGRPAAILHPMLWELWFYLGTVLFCLSFWRFRHASRPVDPGSGDTIWRSYRLMQRRWHPGHSADSHSVTELRSYVRVLEGTWSR